ncbi:hypothetical protein [Thalassolituus alkanivorans]|uniref:hypothetical protein n=1 Tax=Thalassolituus alkanivorans TaxID=2881055 RepID=UPI001E54DC89|nr:hypothetical protein [Thalassolituus alkanivorans]MCB2387253.1 hypothetical protein [Thalassolituus alkanivorans]MCB2421989.1 hypothetical protein [Thalassolituus alkanivorans]
MNLYTVTIDFEDRTRAVMQVEEINELEALSRAIRETETLENHDKIAIEETLDKFLRVTHLAMGYRGVWLWHHVNFENEAVEDIYGGTIVQTDKNGAVRDTSS